MEKIIEKYKYENEKCDGYLDTLVIVAFVVTIMCVCILI